MRVLVTGGAGFIGSHLIENLLQDGHDVVCLDNLSTGRESNLAHSRDRIQFIKGDANTGDLDAAFKDNSFDWVFHYAAVVGVQRTLKNPLAVLNDINGIKRILELSRQNGVKKIVYSSSSEVYGEPVTLPEQEDGVMNAKLPYALVKLIGEKYMNAYFQEFGLNTCSLRFFNVYGPRQDTTSSGFIVGIFMKQILDNKQPTILGDGSQTRDFVYVEDNVHASIEAAKSSRTDGEVLNIGSGKRTSIRELAEVMIKISGKDLKPSYLEARKFDIMHRQADITKMDSLLGYKHKFSLEQGIKKTMDWYKQNAR